jgi:hypothetical protein
MIWSPGHGDRKGEVTMSGTEPWNPLLELLGSTADASDPGRADARRAAIARYGFAVPTEEAIGVLRDQSPDGVVEIGAGTGYWARIAHDAGIDVVAYDIAPAPSVDNRWFAGSARWYHVERADHRAVTQHANRTLLVVWPTKNEVWPVEAIDLYAAAGGRTLVYVGEGPGGQTGDDAFHARLGALTACRQCTYGILDAPCVCAYEAQWSPCAVVELPRWPGCEDDLRVYERLRARRRRWHHREIAR